MIVKLFSPSKTKILSIIKKGLTRNGYCFGTLTEDVIVWKKAYTKITSPYGYPATGRGVLVKLLLTKGTKVGFPTEPCFEMLKMRASKAKVLDIREVRRTTPVVGQRVCSGWNPRFSYVRGKTVKPEKGFKSHHEICASGIHFYMTIKEAQRH
jgi:hypothetical protein